MTDDKSIAAQLASVAHLVRFTALRLLVRAGPPGMSAGKLAARLNVAANALTYHLHKLTNAGLVTARRDGQFIIYTAQFQAAMALAGRLTDACCADSTEKCSDECPTGYGRSAAAATFIIPEKEKYDG